MGQRFRTVCDKHDVIHEELVDTDVPTIRILVDGGNKEMRRDIEGEYCKGCVEELLEFLTPYTESGRRPGTPPKAIPQRPGRKPGSKNRSHDDESPADGGNTQPEPSVRLGAVSFDTPLDPKTKEPVTDEYGKPIKNAGPYLCGAPGYEECIRHRVGFNTKQGRSSHERVGHEYNRNDARKKPTVVDPTKEQIAEMAVA